MNKYKEIYRWLETKKKIMNPMLLLIRSKAVVRKRILKYIIQKVNEVIIKLFVNNIATFIKKELKKGIKWFLIENTLLINFFAN